MPTEAFEPEPSWPRSELEAEVRPSESAAEPVEPNLEFTPIESADARPAYLEADGSEPAPALTEAFEPEASWPADELEAEVQAGESAAEPIEPNLEFTPTLRRPAARGFARGGRALVRSDPHRGEPLRRARSGGRATGSRRAPRGERASADAAERSAEIYVLRHPAPAFSSNIVPIRPGALDALARETAQSFPAESVELSHSERDAFREIARALVGRAPASRDEPSDERTAADNRGTRDRRARRAADRSARRRGPARRRR